MEYPILFSSSHQVKLLPEKMGAAFQAKALPAIKRARYTCEISGFQSHPIKGREHGYMMLEFRNGKEDWSPENLRVVDYLTYWSRHVDIALKHNAGKLIYAPFISQGDLNRLARICLVVKALYTKDPEHDYAKKADATYRYFENLANDHLMLAATGLPITNEWSWDQTKLLKILQELPASKRNHYLKKYVRHLRFLPDSKHVMPAISYWANCVYKKSVGLPEKWEALIK